MTFLKIKLLFSGQCSLCPASNWCPRAILSGFLLESRCPALHRAAPVGTGSYWAQTAPVPKTWWLNPSVALHWRVRKPQAEERLHPCWSTWCQLRPPCSSGPWGLLGSLPFSFSPSTMSYPPCSISMGFSEHGGLGVCGYFTWWLDISPERGFFL